MRAGGCTICDTPAPSGAGDRSCPTVRNHRTYVVDEQDERVEEMDSDDGEWYCGEQGSRHGEGDDVVGSEDVVDRASAAFRVPSHHLAPDWALLTSVWIVIDANIRENGWKGLDGVSEFGRGEDWAMAHTAKGAGIGWRVYGW